MPQKTSSFITTLEANLRDGHDYRNGNYSMTITLS